VQNRRQGWIFWQAHLDPQRLVFLDETGADTKMARRYGRAFRGHRLVAQVPHGHWKTTTFVAGLRCDALVAPLVVDGPLTGDLFAAYVEQHLAPVLKPRDLVILDNLPAHQVRGVRPAIERIGAEVVYLPPYSPDFNPIEQVFAKLKSLLRTAAERTVEALETKISQLLDRFTPKECRNYFRHCGYAIH
jgi:transposase